MASQKSTVKGEKTSYFAIERQRIDGSISQILKGIKDKMANKLGKNVAKNKASKSPGAAKTNPKAAKSSDGGGLKKVAKAKMKSDNQGDEGSQVITTENLLEAAVTQVHAAQSPAVNPAILADSIVDPDEIVLTDADGRRYCRATDCDQVGMVDGYCRYHYLYFWKKIQVRKKILADGKLERYIDELTARYTDKFIELLRKDLRTEKDFLAAVQELELDDSGSSSPQDEDEAKSYLEEISGVASESSSRDDDGY